MKKSILITGVCGAGKTTLSKQLNAMGHNAYDMDSLPNLFAMKDRRTKRRILERDNANLEQVMELDWICDKAKMARIIAVEPKTTTFYCGAASNLTEILPLFDSVFVLTASQDQIRYRLTSRTDNSYGKAPAVQEWILTLQEPLEREMQSRGAIVIDAQRSIDVVAQDVIARTGTLRSRSRMSILTKIAAAFALALTDVL